MAAEAAMVADEAASIAEVAADEAAIIADGVAVSGVVTMVVVEGVVDIVAGGVIVVVDSSFLLQAANETAAASVTINRAVFIFLLGGFKVPTMTGNFGTRLSKSPLIRRHGTLKNSIA